MRLLIDGEELGFCRSASGADAFGEDIEDVEGAIPIDAGVGDADTVGELLTGLAALVASIDVAFNHDGTDGLAAFAQLLGNVDGNVLLQFPLLVAVAMGAVNHDAVVNLGLGLPLHGTCNMLGREIRTFGGASQDEVAAIVTACRYDGGDALLGDGKEVVWVGGGDDAIQGHLNATCGAVLKADGHGETTGKLAVDLAFCRACTNGTPCDEVADVLRGDDIQELGGGGHAHLSQTQQQTTCHAETRVDVEAVIHEWVIDETLPTNRCAWFFKVHTHDDEQVISVLFACLEQAIRVVDGCCHIMDGAGANDNGEAVVLLMEDLAQLFACVVNQLSTFITDGEVLHQDGWRNKRADVLDADVVRVE